MGFTDHDEDISVEGILCQRNSGIEAGSIEERLGLNVDSSEIFGALSSETITAEQIAAGMYDNGKITSYIVNWMSPEQLVRDQVSLIGEIVQEDGVFRLETRGLSSVLDETKGRHFIKRCQASLGDSQCKVNLSSSQFSAEGWVEKVVFSSSVVAGGLEGFESNWFTQGHLKWTSGSNSGKRVEISDHRNGPGQVTLGLWQPAPLSMAIGDQFEISTGCDKQFDTCKQKFSNTRNFRGFPHIPGDSFALSHAANSDQFDGEPLVP